MLEAHLNRTQIYITNPVTHFKWEPRGKIRLHKKSSLSETHACRPYLDAVIDIISQHFITCLGAVVAQGLLGARFRVTAFHRQEQHVDGLPTVIAMLHSASFLRTPRKRDRLRCTSELIADLKRAADFMHRS